MNARPLITHVLYRLDTGGMERIVVSIVNGTGERYRHAVVCLDGFGAMRGEIGDATVPCLSLGKQPGKDWWCYLRLWRTLRQLHPDLVQTYNLGALDMAPVARLAGVRRILHAEHGRDAADPHGHSRKYRRLRRALRPFVTHSVVVSDDLRTWLHADVGVPPGKITCIRNGIDTQRYASAAGPRRERPLLRRFAPPGTLLVGSVGRLDMVKDQAGLIDAFRALCDAPPVGMSGLLRLVIIGEGRERARLEQQVQRLDLHDRVLLPGNRDDVPALLAECDVFALSSVAEGIPLTVLEAMACGLPVVATDVGGVGEVVLPGTTGLLVAPGNPAALTAALGRYARNPCLRQQHGQAGRARVVERFSLPTMVRAYSTLYDELLAGRGMARQQTNRPVGSIKPGED